MERFSSSRDFQIWDYYTSFSQLLLRSVPDASKGDYENIDIIFGGVFYLDIPSSLTGIKIDTPKDDELACLVRRTSIEPDPEGKYHKYFVLESKNNRYYVGAFAISITKNTLSMMETSIGAAYQIPS